MKKAKIRIMLADDHMLMRMGLSTLVACEDDMKIVGEARNGRQAVELALALKPDIIIMDLMMPDAITNGADGALMKDTAANDLIEAIRSIMAGKRLIPERLMRQAEEDNSTPSLSPRHLDILASVAQGQSNSDIAKQFGVSEVAIKKQLSAIFARLGVTNRAEAVALALRKQMLKA